MTDLPNRFSRGRTPKFPSGERRSKAKNACLSRSRRRRDAQTSCLSLSARARAPLLKDGSWRRAVNVRLDGSCSWSTVSPSCARGHMVSRRRGERRWGLVESARSSRAEPRVMAFVSFVMTLTTCVRANCVVVRARTALRPAGGTARRTAAAPRLRSTCSRCSWRASKPTARRSTDRPTSSVTSTTTPTASRGRRRRVGGASVSGSATCSSARSYDASRRRMRRPLRRRSAA